MDLKKTRATAERNEWAAGHYAWPLVQQEGLGVKLEEIPPGGGSDTHHHRRSRQFFFILGGQALVRLDDAEVHLAEQEGVEVELGVAHQIVNAGDAPLTFLLVSAPPVAPDDIYPMLVSSVTQEEGAP
jgi:mannose-6-phosphate isomerase-like protein (cupin superfamily)